MDIGNKILLTQFHQKLFYGLWKEGSPVEFAFFERDPSLQLGDIYQARVKDVLPSIQAAFVTILPGQIGYLPFQEAPNRGEGLKCGQEFPVQITKEAQKTKDPVVSSYLSLAGRYSVLVTDQKKILFSSKISDKDWKEKTEASLTELMDSSFGLILRTESYGAEPVELLREVRHLREVYTSLEALSATRKAETRLWHNIPPWLNKIGSEAVLSRDSYEIVTDDQEIKKICESFLLSRQLSEHFSVRLYQDPVYPLSKLYQLETELSRATDKRVWLKSGAYLVIEHTEAMTIIDVNTGKAEGKRKKEKEEYLLSINLEAGREIARQLRLRNLSGMILIDFIDMKSPENQRELISQMRQWTMSDPVKVNILDLTKLGILECTRKKTSRPLYEQISLLGD